MSKVVLDNVSKVFIGQSGPVQALTDFSLAIAEGEFLCVVGPSGGGKSTLLNLIAGLDRPDQGRILVDGCPVTGPGRDRVVMFQEAALFPWLNVSQNVGFGLKMAGMAREQRQRRVTELLEMVGLAAFASAWVHELSGGMRQRAALAMALATDPGILLMDEPFAALDAQTRDQLHEEIEAIWEATGKTIVFVTHNVREAVRLGSRVILLTGRQGRISQEYPVNLPRHRHLEDVEVVTIAAAIRDDLKQEVKDVATGEGRTAHV